MNETQIPKSPNPEIPFIGSLADLLGGATESGVSRLSARCR